MLVPLVGIGDDRHVLHSGARPKYLGVGIAPIGVLRKGSAKGRGRRISVERSSVNVHPSGNNRNQSGGGWFLERQASRSWRSFFPCLIPHLPTWGLPGIGTDGMMSRHNFVPTHPIVLRRFSRQKGFRDSPPEPMTGRFRGNAIGRRAEPRAGFRGPRNNGWSRGGIRAFFLEATCSSKGTNLAAFGPRDNAQQIDFHAAARLTPFTAKELRPVLHQGCWDEGIWAAGHPTSSSGTSYGKTPAFSPGRHIGVRTEGWCSGRRIKDGRDHGPDDPPSIELSRRALWGESSLAPSDSFGTKKTVESFTSAGVARTLSAGVFLHRAEKLIVLGGGAHVFEHAPRPRKLVQEKIGFAGGTQAKPEIEGHAAGYWRATS